MIECIVACCFVLRLRKRCILTRQWCVDYLQRDGFHWYRPIENGRHHVFLPQDTGPVRCNQDGTCDWRWNKANVQSVGGGIVVPNNGDPLRFYVGARTGVDQLVGNGTAGFAEIRRDVS